MPFKEYGTIYGDGVVETFIVVPENPQQFTIHITSLKHIWEGLAVILFIDGRYQANRHRLNLSPSRGHTGQDGPGATFHIRQKETPVRNGMYIGREWRFDDHNIKTPSGIKEEHFQELGTIEVLVLRCQAQEPKDISTSPCSSAADSDVLGDQKTDGHDGVHQYCASDMTSNMGAEQGNLSGLFDGPADASDRPGSHGYASPHVSREWLPRRGGHADSHSESSSSQDSLPLRPGRSGSNIRSNSANRQSHAPQRGRNNKHVHFDFGTVGPPPSLQQPWENPIEARGSSNTHHTHRSSHEAPPTPIANQPWMSHTSGSRVPVHLQFSDDQGGVPYATPYGAFRGYMGNGPRPTYYPPPPGFLPPAMPSYYPLTNTHYPLPGYYYPLPSPYAATNGGYVDVGTDGHGSYTHSKQPLVPDETARFSAPADLYYDRTYESPPGVAESQDGCGSTRPAGMPGNHEHTSWQQGHGRAAGNEIYGPAHSTEHDSNVDHANFSEHGHQDSGDHASRTGEPHNHVHDTTYDNDHTNSQDPNAGNWSHDTSYHQPHPYNQTTSWHGHEAPSAGTTDDRNTQPWQDDRDNDTPMRPNSGKTHDDWNPHSSQALGDKILQHDSWQGENNTTNVPAAAVPVHGHARPLFGPHGQYYTWKPPGCDEPEAEVEEEPRYDVPRSVVDALGTSKQVQPGKGYLYYKKSSRPLYLDSKEEPYARFVFKYRTKDQLKHKVGIDVETEPSGNEAIQSLQSMDKQTLVEMLARAKMALGGKLPDLSPATNSKRNASECSHPRPVDAPDRSFLRYQIPALRPSHNAGTTDGDDKTHHYTANWNNHSPGTAQWSGGDDQNRGSNWTNTAQANNSAAMEDQASVRDTRPAWTDPPIPPPVSPPPPTSHDRIW